MQHTLPLSDCVAFSNSSTSYPSVACSLAYSLPLLCLSAVERTGKEPYALICIKMLRNTVVILNRLYFDDRYCCYYAVLVIVVVNHWNFSLSSTHGVPFERLACELCPSMSIHSHFIGKNWNVGGLFGCFSTIIRCVFVVVLWFGFFFTAVLLCISRWRSFSRHFIQAFQIAIAIEPICLLFAYIAQRCCGGGSVVPLYERCMPFFFKLEHSSTYHLVLQHPLDPFPMIFSRYQ